MNNNQQLTHHEDKEHKPKILSFHLLYCNKLTLETFGSSHVFFNSGNEYSMAIRNKESLFNRICMKGKNIFFTISRKSLFRDSVSLLIKKKPF